jgi:Ca2+-binding RTX toxin-like protein
MATISGSGGGDTLNDTIGGGNYFDAFGGADTVNAGDGNDSLFGGTGNDRLFGGTGNDSLFGGDNVDSLDGGAGNDTLFGGTDAGAGSDTLRGGADFDYVSYADLTTGVTVNLGTGVGPDGDVIVEVEGVIGSQGADNIAGNDSANRLIGGAGNDTIDASGGNDTVEGGLGNDNMVGGGGTDTLSYDNSATAVNANLASGSATGEGTDTFSGFENLTGSSFADVLTGNGSANTISGGLGNDTIDGGAGADSIIGGPEAGTGTATAPVSLDFNWTAAGADETNLAGGVTQDTGGINVSVSYTGGHPGSTFSVESTGSTAGGAGDFPIYVDTAAGETFNPNSSAELLRPGGQSGTATPTTNVDINFAAVAGSGFQDEVRNVAFRISDIDDAGWRDFVTVRAYDADGNEVPVTFIESSSTLSVVGGVVTAADGTAQSPNSVGGSALVNIAGPVARVVIEYGNLQTDTQFVRVSDIQFQALPTIDNDSILGGTGNDTISGGSGNDTIDAGADNDLVSGGSGNDSVTGGAGLDTLQGDDGNDQLFGGLDNDVITAGTGNDTVFGGDGIDQIDGGDGNDSLSGDVGDDQILGGAGNDQLVGGAGNDVLSGGIGDDTVSGGDGNDILVGGDGNDQIDGGTGNDNIDGGIGSDTINFGPGDDTVFGGDGNDQIDDIVGSALAGNNQVFGGAGNDTVFAGDGNDTLQGDAGNDSLFGEVGNDQLFGGANNDRLEGDIGNDVLSGGTGQDSIFGGGDQDLITVAYTALANDVLGSESVDGGSTGVDNDTLRVDITGLGWTRIDIAYDPTNMENGTITFFGPGPGFAVIGTLTFTDIENLEIVCFTAGTQILTGRGPVAVEALLPGDLVQTRDHGLQPLRWVGMRSVSGAELRAKPELQPVRIGLGALGGAGPARSMLVSPQHRVLIEGAKAEMYFGESEVLVPAKHLVGTAEVTRALPADGVTYVHILFDQHELVLSEGIWTESFQPAERTLSTLDVAARDEVLQLFPELVVDADAFPAARLSLKAHEARVLVSG